MLYFDQLIQSAAGYVSIIPFVWGLFILKRAKATIKLLTLLIGLAFLTEHLSSFLANRGINNLFLFHLYPSAELIIYLLIYRLHFTGRQAVRALFITGLAYVLLSVFNTLYIQHLGQFNTYGRTLESLILSVLGITFLTTTIKNLGSHINKSHAIFWINTGVLFYFPLNLVFFVMSNFLLKNYSNEFHNSLWTLHALLSFAQYVIFTIAIYTEWKRTKSPVLS